MTTTNSSLDVLDQISPTLALDMAMKEIEQSGHEDERMVLVFNALDQIIPQLGVFSSLVGRLRNEFFDFIYSNQFTVENVASRNAKKRKRLACIERLSYKVLCHRLVEQHHEEKNGIENKISDMESDLAGKNRDLNQAREKFEQLTVARRNLYDELEELRKSLEEKDREISTLKEESERIRFNAQQEIQNSRAQVKEIIENQVATEALIDELSKYKQGFDEMQAAFVDSSNQFPVKRRQTAQSEPTEETFVDVKNQLMLDIQVAIRMEEQMLTLLNMVTEDFDQLLDNEHTKLIQTQQYPSDAQFIWNDIESEQIRYSQNIREIREEIDIMQQHRRSLEEKLEMIVIKEREEMKNRRATTIFNANENAQRSGKSINPLRGLEHLFESAGRKTDLVGYAPQERVLSRFSCMMATSLNGRAWMDFPSTSYCDSCADKTYFCPHKFPESDAVIRVPDGTKFIRITRPALKYDEQLIQNVLIDNQNVFERLLPPIYQQNSVSVIRTNYPGYFPADAPSRRETIKSDSQSDAGTLRHTFNRVWADYKRRTDLERSVPRPLSLERVFTLTTEILAYEMYCDRLLTKVTGNIVDDIYEFFQKRYSTIDEIIFNTVHDFFTSLIAYKHEFKILELFAQVIIGNVDVSAIYYITMLADILDKVQWAEPDDVRLFFANVFPFLDEEGLDTSVIDFISFTENKISRFLIVEFIISLLLKGKELWFQEMQSKLSIQITQNYDMMNELEFHTAMESIVHSADERLVSRLFQRAEHHSHWDNLQGFVLMSKCSHIATFLSFTQYIEEQKEGLHEKIQRELNRKRNEPNQQNRPSTKHLVEEHAELFKYTKLQHFGKILYESTAITITDDRRDLNATASLREDEYSPQDF